MLYYIYRRSCHQSTDLRFKTADEILNGVELMKNKSTSLLADMRGISGESMVLFSKSIQPCKSLHFPTTLYYKLLLNEKAWQKMY